MLAAIAGCGGGGGGTAAPALPANQVIASASAIPSNDTAINSSASFTVLQNAGFPAVTVNSPPVVNFTVFSDGAVKTGLTTANVRFAIAKLVPGINGEPDQWVNYISKNVVGIAPAKLASAPQATTDTATPKQLVYNPDGYYTYTFTTDITAIAGVAYEPNLTHRVAIQLSYKNAAGEDVKVNPYFDFTLVNGKSVAVTDPSKTRKMTDVSSCNGCHEKLALHGGGRVDTQYCVMCHNPGTVDPESGNVLTLSTMVHKIHAGKLLNETTGGEDYTIWGYENKKHSYAEVGFPQDLRNCSVCHSGANPKTPQGDNWKTEASKGACLTCHASKVGSAWEVSHKPIAVSFLKNSTAQATDLKDGFCAGCHAPGTSVSPERVHWNQNEENAAKYKMNIESVAFNDTVDHKKRSVTVRYFLSDPTNGNAAYDLSVGCSGTPITCASTTKFGNLSFYLAYQNMIGQSDATTEFSAGSGASAYAYKGIKDSNNHYTLDITLPDDTATAFAKGTARVVSIGQVVEPKLAAISAADPRPVVTGKFVNTVVQHTFKDLALSGSLQPRRIIVSNEKCNVCHGALGTTAGSNTADNAFHSGGRNTVEACVVCHDANRASSSTFMTDGSGFNESYQFKRMIHGIHGNSKRTYPFTHGNPVPGVFSKTGELLLADSKFQNDYTIRGFTPAGTPTPPVVPAGTVVAMGSTFETIAELINTAAIALNYKGRPVVIENYAAEVAYPGVGLNCNACHVNNSYKQDLGTLGAVVSKPVGVTDPMKWLVISPKVATCTSCHDSAKAIEHVTLNIGDPGAVFGTRTQAELNGLPAETCNDCHASGARQAVDLVHGQE
jgi:OmcA/MtrC family decaheme c-type cytochrome